MSNINLGLSAATLKIGRKLDEYTGVVVHVGKDKNGNNIEYSAGDASGYVLDITNPFGTQAQANLVLASLKLRGARYQPYEAGKAILDPSAEIGDNITISGKSSVLQTIKTEHTPLMAANISAPYDEEVDHEFSFVPRTTREFRRESGYTRSRLTIAEDAILAEVIRATASEETLSGRITVAADAIEAKVSKTGGSSSSFAWRLTDSSWSLISNSTTVLSVDSSGLSVKGAITATSGYIGTSTSGFSIDSSNIHNGMTSLSDTTHNGVYVGTDGIALGKGSFKVTSTGAVSCSSITITGGNVYASSIKHGSTGGYLHGSGIKAASLSGGSSGQISSSTLSAWNMDSGVSTNLGYGSLFGSSTVEGTSTYPSYFKAGSIYAATRVDTPRLAGVQNMTFEGRNVYSFTKDNVTYLCLV